MARTYSEVPYFLERNDLLRLERMGQKTADKLLANIAASKSRPLDNALYALGVNLMGHKVTRLLAERYGNVREVMNAPVEEMENTQGIGPKIARAIYQGLRSERVITTVDLMERAGVQAINQAINQAGKRETQNMKEDPMSVNNCIAGKNVVVTGKIEGMTRMEAEQVIQARGGSTAGSVTRDTNLVVVGEKPGSKLSKAKTLGIKVVDQDEFRKLLSGRPMAKEEAAA